MGVTGLAERDERCSVPRRGRARSPSSVQHQARQGRCWEWIAWWLDVRRVEVVVAADGRVVRLRVRRRWPCHAGRSVGARQRCVVVPPLVARPGGRGPARRGVGHVRGAAARRRPRALYFWALQASFLDGGRSYGAAHIGLQWNPRHPSNAAVNWGGYADTGNVHSILKGSPSPLPSTPNDPNTRDYPWRPGVPYRLRISRVASGWRGEITDVSTGDVQHIRDLYAGGDRLGGFVVWAEVFAACDDPSTIGALVGPGSRRCRGRRPPAELGAAQLPDRWRLPEHRRDGRPRRSAAADERDPHGAGRLGAAGAGDALAAPGSAGHRR